MPGVSRAREVTECSDSIGPDTGVKNDGKERKKSSINQSESQDSQREGGNPLPSVAGHTGRGASGRRSSLDQQSGRLAVTRARGNDINSQPEGIQSDDFIIGTE